MWDRASVLVREQPSGGVRLCAITNARAVVRFGVRACVLVCARACAHLKRACVCLRARACAHATSNPSPPARRLQLAARRAGFMRALARPRAHLIPGRRVQRATLNVTSVCAYVVCARTHRDGPGRLIRGVATVPPHVPPAARGPGGRGERRRGEGALARRDGPGGGGGGVAAVAARGRGGYDGCL